MRKKYKRDAEKIWKRYKEMQKCRSVRYKRRTEEVRKYCGRNDKKDIEEAWMKKCGRVRKRCGKGVEMMRKWCGRGIEEILEMHEWYGKNVFDSI